jgi:hypothetical protein
MKFFFLWSEILWRGQQVRKEKKGQRGRRRRAITNKNQNQSGAIELIVSVAIDECQNYTKKDAVVRKSKRISKPKDHPVYASMS